MDKLSRKDLFPLEEYAEMRPEFRQQVLEHKRHRRISLGDHANLYFEDRMTVQYQVQEMLRVERIFEASGIQDELDAYNPLIPDGRNWKATFMLEYPDVDVRRRELARLIGVEDRLWVGVEGFDRVYAIADEDLERETEDKTSSVHFVRFELGTEMVKALHGGAALAIGVDHENLRHEVNPVPPQNRTALLADLDSA